eukprot:Awhi_evm1s12487
MHIMTKDDVNSHTRAERPGAVNVDIRTTHRDINDEGLGHPDVNDDYYFNLGNNKDDNKHGGGNVDDYNKYKDENEMNDYDDNNDSDNSDDDNNKNNDDNNQSSGENDQENRDNFNKQNQDVEEMIRELVDKEGDFDEKLLKDLLLDLKTKKGTHAPEAPTEENNNQGNEVNSKEIEGANSPEEKVQDELVHTEIDQDETSKEMVAGGEKAIVAEVAEVAEEVVITNDDNALIVDDSIDKIAFDEDKEVITAANDLGEGEEITDNGDADSEVIDESVVNNDPIVDDDVVADDVVVNSVVVDNTAADDTVIDDVVVNDVAVEDSTVLNDVVIEGAIDEVVEDNNKDENIIEGVVDTVVDNSAKEADLGVNIVNNNDNDNDDGEFDDASGIDTNEANPVDAPKAAELENNAKIDVEVVNTDDIAKVNMNNNGDAIDADPAVENNKDIGTVDTGNIIDASDETDEGSDIKKALTEGSSDGNVDNENGFNKYFGQNDNNYDGKATFVRSLIDQLKESGAFKDNGNYADQSKRDNHFFRHLRRQQNMGHRQKVNYDSESVEKRNNYNNNNNINNNDNDNNNNSKNNNNNNNNNNEIISNSNDINNGYDDDKNTKDKGEHIGELLDLGLHMGSSIHDDNRNNNNDDSNGDSNYNNDNNENRFKQKMLNYQEDADKKVVEEIDSDNQEESNSFRNKFLKKFMGNNANNANHDDTNEDNNNTDINDNNGNQD